MPDPPEGSREPMQVATDTASQWNLLRRAALPALALLAWSLSAGCASLTSTSHRPSPLSGFLWKGSKQTEEAPGYDQYAMAAAAGRPHIERERAGANPDSGSRVQDPLQNPSRTDLLAQSEKARRRALSPQTAQRPMHDEDIRVTLGQPETLTTVNEAGRAEPEQKLASAPDANWRRGEPPALKTVRQPLTEKKAAVAESRSTPKEKPPVASGPTLQTVLAEARKHLDSLANYQVTMNRVERVGAQLQTEDDVILSVRRNPKAVRLEWTGGPSKGREVIYASAINERTMYVNMANSSLPMPRMSIAVDSPLALRNSRHPITEAGFDTIIDTLVRYQDSSRPEAAEGGKLTYRGIQQPRGLDHRCHLLERITPRGETWQVCLDTETLLPVLVSAVQTKSGELIERYTYRDLKQNPPELALANAFDPDKRWGESQGWLSRLARAATGPANAPAASTTTR